MHHASDGSSLVILVDVAHYCFHCHGDIRKVYTLYDKVTTYIQGIISKHQSNTLVT